MSDKIKDEPVELVPRHLSGSELRSLRLPGGVTFGEVALADPKLAYALVGPKVPELQNLGVGALVPRLSPVLTIPDCPWAWEIINLCASFVSGTAGKTISAQLAGVISRDLWVRKITYTVRRPNAFAGSIFKAQSDHFNKLNPNVDFTLIVKSYWNYVISADPTPLENIEMVFECVCPVGFVLGCASTISATFTLLRALAADEIPYNVCISLHAVSLPRRYDCSLDEALVALAAREIDCCF